MACLVWSGLQKKSNKIIFVEAPMNPFGNMADLMPLKPLGWIGETRMKRRGQWRNPHHELPLNMLNYFNSSVLS